MLQTEFATAIGVLDQTVAHPRFGIYRNNVASALTNSLRVRYPVVEELVGREFFGMMAREFISEHKPVSAMLITYGANYPEFISSFAAAAPVPYLGDVAKLESAWWISYHAADAEPLNRNALAGLSPEAWGETHLRFLPSVKILSFDYAAVSIWQAHQNNGPSMPSLVTKAECALIHREGSQVMVHSLTQDMHLFLDILAQGGTLLDAYERASDHNEGFDILAAVQQLFHFNIIVELY